MDAARYELDIYVGNEQSEKAKLVQLETGLETARQHDADNKRYAGGGDGTQGGGRAGRARRDMMWMAGDLDLSDPTR